MNQLGHELHAQHFLEFQKKLQLEGCVLLHPSKTQLPQTGLSK